MLRVSADTLLPMKSLLVVFLLTVRGCLRSRPRSRLRCSRCGTSSTCWSGRVERDASNRAVRIIAASDNFYRSSGIPLDGENRPNIAVVDLRQLPTGTYQVTRILVGTRGQLG
jgi:hypothetical protein